MNMQLLNEHAGDSYIASLLRYAVSCFFCLPRSSKRQAVRSVGCLLSVFAAMHRAGEDESVIRSALPAADDDDVAAGVQ